MPNIDPRKRMILSNNLREESRFWSLEYSNSVEPYRTTQL